MRHYRKRTYRKKTHRRKSYKRKSYHRHSKGRGIKFSKIKLPGFTRIGGTSREMTYAQKRDLYDHLSQMKKAGKTYSQRQHYFREMIHQLPTQREALHRAFGLHHSKKPSTPYKGASGSTNEMARRLAAGHVMRGSTSGRTHASHNIQEGFSHAGQLGMSLGELNV